MAGFLFLLFGQFLVIISIESKEIWVSGLWWPANTVQKHRNLMFSVLFASLSSLAFMVGEPFTERDGAFVC